MTEALGLGGFPFFAAHPYGWTQTLGFRMNRLPFSRTIGAGLAMRSLLRLLDKDPDVFFALGLEQGSDVLIKPFCPPYYANMKEAVRAFLDSKFNAANGSLSGLQRTSAWQDQAQVKSEIKPPSEKSVEATIAYCEYVYQRYGRFPPGNGPFRTVLGFEVHRPDKAFYMKFYDPEQFTPRVKDAG
jgi:hypothetical protein